MQRYDMVKILRDLADSLESSDMPIEVAMFDHLERVPPLYLGDTMTDAMWKGRSIVIHYGDLGMANHMTLAKRLTP